MILCTIVTLLATLTVDLIECIVTKTSALRVKLIMMSRIKLIDKLNVMVVVCPA